MADLRTSPLAARFFAEFDHATVDGDAAKFLAETRLRPIEDVDLVVFAARGWNRRGRRSSRSKGASNRSASPRRSPRGAPRRARRPAGPTSS